MMPRVNLKEAKSSFAKLMRAVEDRGEIIVLCRNGRPVARLVPYAGVPIDHFRRDPRLAGVLTEDPAKPLPEEAWYLAK